jgi:hypothetical protein
LGLSRHARGNSATRPGIPPFLPSLPAQCLTAETAELPEREAERPGQRIDCLSRNRDAILGYLAAVRGPAGPRV